MLDLKFDLRALRRQVNTEWSFLRVPRKGSSLQRTEKWSKGKQAGQEKRLIKEYQNPGVAGNACNTSLWEVEAGGVQGQPEIHSELLVSVGCE